MTEGRTQIDWRPAPAEAVPERSIRDDPGRIVLLVAAVGLLVSSILPWAEGRHPAGFPIAYTPQQALAEGYILLVLALVLAFLARGRLLVESTSRTVQLSPLIIAVVAGTMWLGADRTSIIFITEWTIGGGFGTQTVWRLVCAASIVAIVAGTIWLEMTRPAHVRAETRGLVAEWKPSRVGLAEGLLAAALGIGLAVVGGALTMIAMGPNGAFFAVFVSLFGMAAGISAGLGIVRWVRGGSDQPVRDEGMESTKGRVEISRVERRH